MSLEADVPVQVLEVESLAWIDKLPVPYQAVGAGCVLPIRVVEQLRFHFSFGVFYHEHRVVSEGQGTSKYQATCQGNKNTRPLVDSSGFQLQAGQDSGVR